MTRICVMLVELEGRIDERTRYFLVIYFSLPKKIGNVALKIVVQWFKAEDQVCVPEIQQGNVE